MQRIIIALGAGIASAVLFVLPMERTALAAALGVAAPLPLMIALFGFGQIPALGGAAVGVVMIAYLLHPLFAAFFILWIALPVGWLTHVALRRQANAGTLAAWAAGLASALSLGLLAAAILRYGSWSAAVNVAADRLQPSMQELIGRSLPAAISVRDLTHALMVYVPVMMAAWTVLTLCVNLWAAGRLVAVSHLLPRPWPNVPDTLRLPRLLALAFAVALGGSLAKGAIGVGSASVAAALGAAFALQGLGALHAMTRGAAARGVILGAAYALLVALLPWPLLLAAGLGLVDCFTRLPRRPLIQSINV
ncbi:MAG TPA: hypothetical protein VMU56_02890 [Beijerinckiaceae bacterium]|nr:hypothetical protein [Beijerinckiaceae bacterium]HVB90196.1 hypothetical protein [Beijerinckiaceae bacterium]